MIDTLVCVSDRPTKVMDLLTHHLYGYSVHITYVIGKEHELVRMLKNKSRTESVVAYYDTMGCLPAKIKTVHTGSHKWHMAKMIVVINPRNATSVRSLYSAFGSPTPDGVGVYFMSDNSDEVVLRYRPNGEHGNYVHDGTDGLLKLSIKTMSWC